VFLCGFGGLLCWAGSGSEAEDAGHVPVADATHACHCAAQSPAEPFPSLPGERAG